MEKFEKKCHLYTIRNLKKIVKNPRRDALISTERQSCDRYCLPDAIEPTP